ncbi:hypothetical protein M5X11_15910 [Paenibacillus alginolyticus]|uniref:hypothetical protein n=1 Tax=Paenibacillus alginolyticus TaxID=59839 RepID=UPI000FD8918E|nr:hypothetical protein [Paenibacillus alginolyticus]MCY9666429.1 hypothetical protein [Paenibacillus alginolyticus]
MRHLRYTITIQELKKLTDSASIKRYNEYWDPRVGDHFVIQDSDEIHVVHGDNVDEGEGDDLDGYWLSYINDEGKQWVSIEECLPIVSIQQMMEMIDLFDYIQIQKLSGGYIDAKWMVIVGPDVFIGEDDEEQLVSVMWKALIHYLSIEDKHPHAVLFLLPIKG